MRMFHDGEGATRHQKVTKCVMVEMELLKEDSEYNERSETGASSELKTSLVAPRQEMSIYVEVRGRWEETSG